MNVLYFFIHIFFTLIVIGFWKKAQMPKEKKISGLLKNAELK